nr:MAG TPA: hypothetical protein [Caudoviricetes sp.]
MVGVHIKGTPYNILICVKNFFKKYKSLLVYGIVWNNTDNKYGDCRLIS